MAGTRRFAATFRAIACGLCLVATATGPGAAAADAPESLEPGGEAVVAEVRDGNTIVLETAIDGAREVRLEGLETPQPPLVGSAADLNQLASQAAAALADLVEGRRVRVSFGAARVDRYGRLRAHVHRDDGVWAQGEMLRRGWARVQSFEDVRGLVPEMLALEQQARAARRGIWAHPAFAVLTPEGAEDHINSVQIVEGRIAKAVKVRDRTYLNFGEDWRTDFTASISGGALRLFTKAGLDPLTLEGQVIRVRGWLEDYNGPLIEVTHPEQIEIVASSP